MSSQLSREVNRLGQSILLKYLPISALRLARISRLNTYFVERTLSDVDILNVLNNVKLEQAAGSNNIVVATI